MFFVVFLDLGGHANGCCIRKLSSSSLLIVIPVLERL